MEAYKLLNYMEDIRVKRKISQRKYLEDIVSQRQYYRYRNNESNIPFEIFNLFAKRLEIPLFKIISSYIDETEKEKEIVFKYCNLVMQRRLDDAEEIIKAKNKMNFIDKQSKMLYDFSNLYKKYLRQNITINQLVVLTKETIDFKSLLKKKMLYDTELYMMGIIMDLSQEDRKKVLKHIINVHREKHFILSKNIFVNLQAYFWIIKNMGREKEYENLIPFTEQAINLAEKNYYIYSLEYFYYYKALAHYYLQQMSEFKKALEKTVYCLFNLNEHKKDRFIKTIKKDTQVDVLSFILPKIKNLLS